MNKGDVISAIADRTQVTKSQVEKIMNAFISVVNENIGSKEDIRITGFGTLGVAKRKEREGRNPVTGEKITIESRFAPFFRASKELKEAANKLDD